MILYLKGFSRESIKMGDIIMAKAFPEHIVNPRPKGRGYLYEGDLTTFKMPNLTI